MATCVRRANKNPARETINTVLDDDSLFEKLLENNRCAS
jgi:hypothetical protein